jgi:hypothetical protein
MLSNMAPFLNSQHRASPQDSAVFDEKSTALHYLKLFSLRSIRWQTLLSDILVRYVLTNALRKFSSWCSNAIEVQRKV